MSKINKIMPKKTFIRIDLTEIEDQINCAIEDIEKKYDAKMKVFVHKIEYLEKLIESRDKKLREIEENDKRLREIIADCENDIKTMTYTLRDNISWGTKFRELLISLGLWKDGRGPR